MTHEQRVELARTLWEAFDSGYRGEGALASDLMSKDRMDCYLMGRERAAREAGNDH